MEKQKFVYIMNRDANNKLTISSPLEAHKSETIIFSVVGVDVGFDNPIFAMIELEYKEADQDPTGKNFFWKCDSMLSISYLMFDLWSFHLTMLTNKNFAHLLSLCFDFPLYLQARQRRRQRKSSHTTSWTWV